eukprot:SM000045S16285  [mRNA]  locus=s45:632485:636070:- [translate_table: standard]
MALLSLLLDATLLPLLMALLRPVAFASWLFGFATWLFGGALFDVRGKVVAITGASSGIGKSMAHEYARRGAKLVLAARRLEKLQEVAEQCRQLGSPSAVVCKADVSKESDCQSIIDTSLHHFNRLDILVNNAGTGESGLFEDYENVEDFQKTVEVDLWGNILPTMYALPHLRKVKGQAVKAGLVQFYDTLRAEPIGADIAITILLPGFITSELTSRAPPEHIPKWWPMMATDTAAASLVEQSLQRKHYVVVPAWYATWLPYRLLTPELMDWTQRVLLMRQPPSRAVANLMPKLWSSRATAQSYSRSAIAGANSRKREPSLWTVALLF